MFVSLFSNILRMKGQIIIFLSLCALSSAILSNFSDKLFHRNENLNPDEELNTVSRITFFISLILSLLNIRKISHRNKRYAHRLLFDYGVAYVLNLFTIVNNTQLHAKCSRKYTYYLKACLLFVYFLNTFLQTFVIIIIEK